MASEFSAVKDVDASVDTLAPTGRVDIVTSRLVSSTTLMIFRLGTWIWSVSKSGGSYFRYMTDLAWTGLGFYFLVAAWLTARYKAQGFTLKSGLASRGFDFLHSTAFLFSFLVPIVYWVLLSHDLFVATDATLIFSLAYPHTFDFIFCIIEIVLSKVPLPFWHSIYPFSTMILYLVWSWIFYYTGTYPMPYDFMTKYFRIVQTPGTTILAILVTAVLHELIFVLPWACCFLRDRFSSNAATVPAKQAPEMASASVQTLRRAEDLV